MKSKIILLVLIVQLYSYGYELMESWLATPGNYTVYLTQEVYNLQATWGLNLSSCVTAVNNHGVTNVPTFIAGSNYSETELCIVKYEPYTDFPPSVAKCIRSDYGEYHSFTIIVNELEYYPATYGLYNINSVMTHEITHSLGMADNSDPTTLMFGTAGSITSLTNDDINGIRNVYEKPKVEILSKHQVFNGNMFAIFEDDSVEFIIRGIDFLTHNSVLPKKVLHDRFFLIADESSFNGFYGRLDTLAYNIYKLKASSSELETDQIKKLRTYQRRDAFENILSRYKNENAPCSLLTFEVLPECFTKLNLDSTASSSKYYSFDDKYYFSATCVDSSGADYPNLQDIKFYYKKATESSYTMITTKALTKYSRYWNSGTYKGDVTIKAVASFLLETGSSIVLTDTDSMNIRILDGFECKITEPKPYDVEAVDFEKLLRIEGLLHHNGTIDTDTLQVRNYIYDKQLNWASIFTEDYATNYRCPKYKYLWENDPLPWPSGTPLKKETITEKKAVFKNTVENKDVESKIAVVSDTLIWNTGDNWLYGQSFYTYPGIYKLSASAYDSKMNYLVAKTDTLWMMKPSWKLKLNGDFWYPNYQFYGLPYTDKTVYAPEQKVNMYIWRPFVGRNFESTNISVSYEGNTVANMVTSASDYNEYQQMKHLYFEPEIFRSDTFKVSTANPACWVRTGDEPQGFYEITASEYDTYAGVNVIQKKEIQIPPLYVTAETDGYLSWPVSVWPRGYEYEDMDNADNWVVSRVVPLRLPLGKKALCCYYRSMENKSNMELSHPGITIKKDFNTEFKFAIGLKTVMYSGNCVFENLLAKYTVSLSIDGGADIDFKTASVNEWSQTFGTENLIDSIYYYIGFTVPLGKQVTEGSNIKIKLKTRGIYFTELDNIQENKDQEVMFDELGIFYTRKECPEAPALSKASYISNKGNDYVEISFSAPVNSPVAPYGYNIYRNGIKLVQISNTSYQDFDISSGTTYNYAVTAAYNGLDYPESSIVDCYFTVTTGQIVYPRPRDFTLVKGDAENYNTVYLSWECPVGDSVSVYNVYRNDIIIAQTEDTDYIDLWLEQGEYYYCVSAVYSGGSESDDTETLLVTIINPDGLSLPMSKDFENGGTIPEFWEVGGCVIVNRHPYNWWEVASTTYTGQNAYSGDYLANIGTGPFTSSSTEYDTWARDCITSPKLNLTNYKNVNLSLKYYIEGYTSLNERTSNFIRLLMVNTDQIDTLADGTPNWWSSSIDLFSIDSIGPDKYTTDWVSLNVPIDNSYLNDKVQIGIFAQVDNYYLPINKKLYLYYAIDSLVVTGSIKAESPENLVIVNNNGTMNLTWDSVADATQYYIYRSDKPDVAYQEIGSSAIASYSDDITGLPDGFYFYKVVSEVVQKIYQASGGDLNNHRTKTKEVEK